MPSDHLSSIMHYGLDALKATGAQLFLLLGPLVLLALMLHFVSSGLRHLGFSAFGEKGFIYGFKLIGTPIHELGHVVFAALFGHRIVGVKWFDPKGKGGTYGHVKTRYNQRNPFHQIGLFFSGIGPVLMCAIMLYLITWLLFDTHVHHLFPLAITPETFVSFSAAAPLANGIIEAVREINALLFLHAEHQWWKTALFLYLFFSIGSSMTLSPPDIKLATKGFVFLTVLLLLINLVTFWTGIHLHALFSRAVPYISAFLAVMVMALITQLLFALVLALIGFVKTLFIK